VADDVAHAGGERKRAVAAGIAAAAVAALIALALFTGRDDDPAGGLRVERTPGTSELIVSVEDSERNVPGTAAGARSVMVECLDRDGEVLIRTAQAWPFADTDGGTGDPHVHISLDPERMARVSRCRVNGTDPALEGGVL
jgi:hypothetical protein